MTEPYFHLDGDRTKAPIDPRAQKPGAKIVLVTAEGRDYHFMAGRTVTNSMAGVKDRFDKGNAHLTSES